MLVILIGHNVLGTNLDDALAAAQGVEGADVVWIGGGTGIYKETFATADYLHITMIDADFEGDTVFPEGWAEHFPTKVSQRDCSDSNYKYSFNVYSKKKE